MSSEMIDATAGTTQDDNSCEVKVDLNLSIKQETGSEVEIEEHDLNLNVKQETLDETSSEIKIEEHGVHFTVKREEEHAGFSSTPVNCTTTFLESELQIKKTRGLTEGKEDVNETDSDSEVEDTKTNKSRFKCDKCTYQTKSSWSIRQHAYSHDKEKLVSCRHCSYKGRHKTHLLLHLKRCHPGELPHACDICSYRSFDLSSLEEHREKHKREPMKCEFCNEFATTDSVQMRTHKRRVHMQKCPHCKYKSLYADRLQQHMLMHETKKILSCTNCNYKTELQYNLDRHVRCRHTVGNTVCRMYNCPDCPFETKHRNSYKSHLYRHNGELPFPCDQCDYRALQKHHLEEHILYKHSNEKPFKCQVCQKGYAVQSELKVHLVVHSKEKQYCCDECNFSTAYKSRLKTHKELKCWKTLACQVCSYKARCASDIKSHVKEHVSHPHFKKS